MKIAPRLNYVLRNFVKYKSVLKIQIAQQDLNVIQQKDIVEVNLNSIYIYYVGRQAFSDNKTCSPFFLGLGIALGKFH